MDREMDGFVNWLVQTNAFNIDVVENLSEEESKDELYHDTVMRFVECSDKRRDKLRNEFKSIR